MKYVKLVAKISKLISLEYEKMETVALMVEDGTLNDELREMLAEKTIKKVCKELESELI